MWPGQDRFELIRRLTSFPLVCLALTTNDPCDKRISTCFGNKVTNENMRDVVYSAMKDAAYSFPAQGLHPKSHTNKDLLAPQLAGFILWGWLPGVI